MTHLTLAVSGRLPLRAKLKIRESGITGTVPPTLFLSGTHSRRSGPIAQASPPLLVARELLGVRMLVVELH